jgi:hypothetical protein
MTIACFGICVAIWHFKQGVTAAEAIGLFIASIFLFNLELKYLYIKNTADHYFMSGYATSLVYRPAYKADNVNVPESWWIEQSKNKPTRNIKIQRYYSGKDRNAQIEHCYGECALKYARGNPSIRPLLVGSPDKTSVILIEVNKEKFLRTKIGETSVAKVRYYNPVLLSDDIIYSDSDAKEPYLFVNDFNKTNRIIANELYQKTYGDELELLNADLASSSNVSVSLHITSDDLYFEKLKRNWHNGKANDFAIIINSLDGKQIRNVDVLAWGNYNLRENVSQAIGGLTNLDGVQLIKTIEETMKLGPVFVPMEFKKLNFLEIKIPRSDYLFIMSFHLFILAYYMILINLDPSTKTQKASWKLIRKTWQRHPNPPPPWPYYFHFFSSSGLLFYYTMIPFFLFFLWEYLFL